MDIETDHKSLEALIKKPLAQVPIRIQRLLLRLQRYDVALTYRPGKEFYIADAISRACINYRDSGDIELDNEIDCHVHCLVNYLPLSFKLKLQEFKVANASDMELRQLKKW